MRPSRTKAEVPADTLVLVGDVGGTNCRLAIASRAPGADWSFSRARTYRDDDFQTFDDAVSAYLRQERVSVSGAVIAVAGPIEEGSVTMTNHRWRISERQLAVTLGGASRCRLINDFEALARALPALTAADLLPLGAARAVPPRATLAALGAGTGLGVAALVRNGAHEAVLVGEGGHIAFAPQTDLELEIWRRLARDQSGYVSVEHVLSGAGLVRLHRALCEVGGKRPTFTTPDAITAAAAAGDEQAIVVADLFVQIFGSVAGDIALVYGARGGVFVAGGVSQRLLTSRAAAAFRARFEAKGDFSRYLTGIPTYTILHPQPGLLGVAQALADPAILGQ